MINIIILSTRLTNISSGMPTCILLIRILFLSPFGKSRHKNTTVNQLLSYYIRDRRRKHTSLPWIMILNSCRMLSYKNELKIFVWGKPDVDYYYRMEHLFIGACQRTTQQQRDFRRWLWCFRSCLPIVHGPAMMTL
jgi:hypothetical protein